MNTYVTSITIKRLREKQNLTQAELAERIGVSSKTISKWETAKGLPDVSLLQPLAQALNISLIELMNGEHIINRNTSANMLRTKFHVCPVCGNIIHSTGDSVISCCGITLPALEAEEAEADAYDEDDEILDEEAAAAADALELLLGLGLGDEEEGEDGKEGRELFSAGGSRADP